MPTDQPRPLTPGTPVPFPEPITGYSVEGTGLVFYGDPATLSEGQIDPLLWPIVQRINESGWVWTAEACQGHPDDDTPQGPWAGNHRPMIRLVCRVADLGRLLVLLAEATQPSWDDNEFSPIAWEPWVSFRPREQPRYAEALIYVGRVGQAIGGRDQALRAWQRFADAARSEARADGVREALETAYKAGIADEVDYRGAAHDTQRADMVRATADRLLATLTPEDPR